jgi:hypothetical protein
MENTTAQLKEQRLALIADIKRCREAHARALADLERAQQGKDWVTWKLPAL